MAAKKITTGKPKSAFPFKKGVNIDLVGFSEPSGIAFHPSRNTLFVVGDEGEIEEVQTDGRLVHRKHLKYADLEGITFDPATGLLYVAVEGSDEILEITPDKFEITRCFRIKRKFEGKKVLAKKGAGIESIAFVPNPKNPEGGTFFVTNQSTKKGAGRADRSALIEIEAPLKTSKDKWVDARIVAYIPMDVLDLAGIGYDYTRDLLLVVSDSENTLLEVTRDGVVKCSYRLPGKNQEGVDVDNEGNLYVAQDSGGIVKYERTKGASNRKA